MDRSKDNLLWNEIPSDKQKSLWADDSLGNNKTEQPVDVDWIFKETFLDKLERLFNHRNKYDRKVLNRNDLTDEERLFIPMEDFNEYNCGCKCDLKECDNACWNYFVLQDARPYRNVDINIPELKYLSQEDKLISYNHFKKMLKKRNCNPYYFFKYMFSKLYFWNYKRLNKIKKLQ